MVMARAQSELLLVPEQQNPHNPLLLLGRGVQGFEPRSVGGRGGGGGGGGWFAFSSGPLLQLLMMLLAPGNESDDVRGARGEEEESWTRTLSPSKQLTCKGILIERTFLYVTLCFSYQA